MSNKVVDFSGKKATKLKKLTLEVLTNMVISKLEEEEDTIIYEIEKGILMPCAVDKATNQVTIIQGKHLVSYIKTLSEGLHEELKGEYYNADFCYITGSTAQSITATAIIAIRLRHHKRIKNFAFKSDKNLTFCRIPFDPCKEVQPTPTWDDLLSAFTNTEGLKAWIGSLFYEDSDRSQYLWLYGKGKNGKSTMARVISSLLGKFVASVNAPEGESARKHFTSYLLGKRLAVFDDFKICKGADNFMRSGLLKNITGGYRVPVEKKFQDAYDTELNCKFLFTSNIKPKISKDPSDQRRIVYCEAKQRNFVVDTDFEPRLGRELPQFISNCMLIYKAACPDNRPIIYDQTESIKLADEFFEYEDAFIHDHFLINKEKYVTVSEFVSVLTRSGSRLSKSSLYDYLEGIGIEKSVVMELGIKKRVLKGLALKYIF
jgi:hypothetical protein